MPTNYIGFALKRISFYPDRGQVAEFFEPSSGQWREQEGRVPGLHIGHCPESCVFQEKTRIPRDQGGTIVEVCHYVKPIEPPAEEQTRARRHGR